MPELPASRTVRVSASIVAAARSAIATTVAFVFADGISGITEGRADCAGGQDDLAARSGVLCVPVLDVVDATTTAVAVDHELVHERIGPDLEVGAAERPAQVGVEGALPHSADDAALEPGHALLPLPVDVGARRVAGCDGGRDSAGPVWARAQSA